MITHNRKKEDENYLFFFINYNTIINYILFIYEQSYFDQVLGLMAQTRVSRGNRNHETHANSLAHYSQDYQGTQENYY